MCYIPHLVYPVWEPSSTIKVYEPEIVCASQFWLIESFNLTVIKESVYACRHNYNMQMIQLLPEEASHPA